MLKTMKLGIVNWQFPVVSETFVLDHVSGMLERDVTVGVFSWTREPEHVHGEAQSSAVKASVHRWLPRTRWNKVTAAVRILANTSPLAYPAALRLGLDRRTRTALLLGHALRRFLRDDGVIHAHFGTIGERIAQLKCTGIVSNPLVVSLHGFDATRNADALRDEYRYLFLGADRIVVTTGFMEQQARALGCPPEKLVRNPIGIRPDRFTFTERRWTEGQPLRLLSTGRLVEKKGIEYAIRALAVLVGRGIQVEYRIVGDGPLMPSLRALATDLGVAAAVTFCGALARERVAEELSQCHMFLFPSVKAQDGDQEGQGMALIEAQASGAVCIATHSGGIPEVLQEGVNGYLAPERNARAIAEAVLALTARHNDWPGMGRAGRTWIERKFSLGRHLDELEQTYHQLSADPIRLA